MAAELDPARSQTHIASMSDAFDTLAAADALRDAGMEPEQARAVATQLRAAAGTGDAVTRPELEAALARLKTELLTDLLDRIAESERRTAASLWRLFGGMVAVSGLAVAAVRLLPAGAALG